MVGRILYVFTYFLLVMKALLNSTRGSTSKNETSNWKIQGQEVLGLFGIVLLEYETAGTCLVLVVRAVLKNYF